MGRRLWLGTIRSLRPVLSDRQYMGALNASLRALGMDIQGEPLYISSSVWFDGTDYGLIRIEHKAVISSHVSILTHDFSLSRARDALANATVVPEIAVVRGVRIGSNSFIGRGATLMPGANVGANVIVGAGSVVRGEVPDDAIIMGNPAEIVGNALNWGRDRLAQIRTGASLNRPGILGDSVS